MGLQPPLDCLEDFRLNDGLMCPLHPVPGFLRHVDEPLGFVADLFSPPLDHHARIHFIPQDAPDRDLAPKASVHA